MRRLISITLATICVAFFGFRAIAQETDLNKGIEFYNQSTKAYEEKEYDKAIQLANDAYKIASDAGDEGVELKGNLEKLIPQLYYIKASGLISDSKFDEAIKALDEAKEIATKYNAADIQENITKAYPQVYLVMGKNSFDANEFDAALENINKAIELDATNPDAYLLQGGTYLKKGDITKTEESFTKMLEVAETAGEANKIKMAKGQLAGINLQKAQAAYKAKKWADMFKFAEASLEYNESANAFRFKAMSAVELKKWDTAIEAANKLMTLSPKDANHANYYLAQAYQGKGNKAKACELYKKLLNDKSYKSMAEYQRGVLKCN